MNKYRKQSPNSQAEALVIMKNGVPMIVCTCVERVKGHVSAQNTTDGSEKTTSVFLAEETARRNNV